MNLEKFSERSQKVVQDALFSAKNFSHQHVTALHVFKAICEKPTGDMFKLVESSGLTVQEIQSSLIKNLEQKPRVQGSSDIFWMQVLKRP